MSGLLAGAALSAQAADAGLEAKVKAAYLYNFTKFVEWQGDSAGGLVLCVAGSDAVGDVLSDLSNRQAKGRAIRVVQGVPADPGLCQVLYISQSESKWAELLELVRGRNVLTVGDAADFARNGGVIGFYNDAGKIKLEINADKARLQNVKVSAKLMEVAKVTP